MGGGTAVAVRRRVRQARWQNLETKRPKDVQTWTEGNVRLLHASRTV